MHKEHRYNLFYLYGALRTSFCSSWSSRDVLPRSGRSVLVQLLRRAVLALELLPGPVAGLELLEGEESGDTGSRRGKVRDRGAPAGKGPGRGPPVR